MNVDSVGPGLFCWTDLSTPDAAGAKTFYTSLFGWEFEELPMGEGASYTMLKKDGRNVGALYPDSKPGIPPHWDLYISVPSADEAAAKAKSLGGMVIVEPFDVMEVGRMAVLQDPTGATFCASIF